MADAQGNKLVDYAYLDYGRPVERRILVDGRAGWITDADADTPLPGITTLEFDPGALIVSTDELAGMQLYISLPYESADRVRAGTILWNDADTIWVEDPDDLIFDALDPMGSIEADWVVYDFRANIADTQRFFQVQDVAGDTVTTDPIFLGNEIGWVVQGDPDPATIVNMSAPNTLVFDGDQTGNLTQYNFYLAERPGDWTYPTTAGVWTSRSYSSGVTTLESTDARFETFMEGWLIAPDAACSTHGFAYLEILEVTGANSLTVKGDLTWMLNGDERFWIFAPPSVDAQTGAIRGTYTGSTFKPAKCESRHLWAQYRYTPPMAGYEVNPGTPGIYGKQPGTNQTGTYHAWNRQYDPGTGRWTTPDPAMSPWGNLWDYVGQEPAMRTDPIGLFVDGIGGYPVKQLGELIDYLRRRWSKQVQDAQDDLASYGNWCGPGGNRAGDGSCVDNIDNCCKLHDECFQSVGVSADSYMQGRMTPAQAHAAKQCNDTLILCLGLNMEGASARAKAYASAATVLFTLMDNKWKSLRDRHPESTDPTDEWKRDEYGIPIPPGHKWGRSDHEHAESTPEEMEYIRKRREAERKERDRKDSKLPVEV